MCSVDEVFRCGRLDELDVTGCDEVPVARYSDHECGAILWISRTRPLEQTLDVVARASDGTYGEVLVSGSSDWGLARNVPPGETWFSGFSASTPLPSGHRGVFGSGVLGSRTDVVSFGPGAGSTQVRDADRVAGAFVVRLPEGVDL